MLKLGKVYIHMMTIAMFIVFVLNGHIKELLCAYTSMLLHETAHLLAAVSIGLCVSHITLYPFGVNLKLKNKLVANLADELILYLSGPFMNLILALAALISGNPYLYHINILLFAVNMLPVLPLDGGCIVRRIVAGRIGTIRASKVMKRIGAVIAALLLFLGLYTVYITGYNYSVLLFTVFIIGNVFTQKEKYNTEYIRELMFYREKSLKNVKLTAAYCDEDARDVAKKFMPGAYSVVCELERNGKVKRFITETEVINKIFTENK